MWTASLVSWIFELFNEVWSLRNQVEFGANIEDQRRKSLVVCERAIRRLYAVGLSLPHLESYPFKVDMESLLMSQLAVQEQWIFNTERFPPGALKRAADGKNSGQKSITEFFGEGRPGVSCRGISRGLGMGGGWGVLEVY